MVANLPIRSPKYDRCGGSKSNPHDLQTEALLVGTGHSAEEIGRKLPH